jgi:hypothetical protein
VGVGDPLEAAIDLDAPIKAGPWSFVGDGIIIASVDVQFDVIWRSGGTDKTLVSFTHHFDKQPTGFDAVPFEAQADGMAAAASPGDQLVLRFTALTTDPDTPMPYIPNGDGARTNGRIPTLMLPR